MNKLLLIFLLVFVSCSPFDDYNEKQEGLHLKLCAFEEGNVSFRPSYYKEASVVVRSGEEIIFRNYREQLIPALDKRLNFLFEHLTEGDSAQFKLSAKLFHEEMGIINTPSDEEVYYDVEVKVIRFLKSPPENFDAEMQEQIILNKYLADHAIKKSRRGVYIKQLQQGEGQKIKRDKVVTIHYVGHFINELEFDNTYNGAAFTFTYGTPGQVIPGLEIALKGMKAGEKAKIIIPSQLAFKDGGSSTGVVPPWSTVIYELEIVNVK